MDGGVTKLTFTALFPFGGIAGGALGFQRANAALERLGIEASRAACRDDELRRSIAFSPPTCPTGSAQGAAAPQTPSACRCDASVAMWRA